MSFHCPCFSHLTWSANVLQKLYKYISGCEGMKEEKWLWLGETNIFICLMPFDCAFCEEKESGVNSWHLVSQFSSWPGWLRGGKIKTQDGKNKKSPYHKSAAQKSIRATYMRNQGMKKGQGMNDLSWAVCDRSIDWKVSNFWMGFWSIRTGLWWYDTRRCRSYEAKKFRARFK